MKKIGIDARLYFQTGVGTYLRNLLHYLQEAPLEGIQIFVYVLPGDVGRIKLANQNFVIRSVDAPWHTVREQTVFYQTLMHDQLDLMHFTYFSYPVFYKRPFIATVHDVTQLLFKTGKASTLNPVLFEIKHVAFKYVLSQQINQAKLIITPTRAVKHQLMEMYGHTIENKIFPIYEGVSIDLMKAVENAELKKSLTEPYFLYVGNFYPHKNVDKLLEAFQLSSQSKRSQKIDDPIHLILVGPDNMFAQKLKQKIKREKIENVQFDHNAGCEELIYYYNHAKALINPSLSEGFGLPLIEATYFGCPVIASDIPVFKEVLG
ncbi:MAG: glycosyltransferase family 1 protein, partial [Candidatus Roizmanbacteria bacterium]|nr:glycosyltransferase family 1 protein [Candidatus Roizmanbacteria bacterium]